MWLVQLWACDPIKSTLSRGINLDSEEDPASSLSRKQAIPSLATPPTTSVGEDTGGERNPLTLLVGM
jgi:hypothetical protein